MKHSKKSRLEQMARAAVLSANRSQRLTGKPSYAVAPEIRSLLFAYIATHGLPVNTASIALSVGGNMWHEVEEVFEKLRGDIFVNMIFARELNCDAHHVQRKHSHPTRAVALFEMTAVREFRIAIEHAKVLIRERGLANPKNDDAAIEKFFGLFQSGDSRY